MASVKVPIRSEMIEWACARNRTSPERLEETHPKLRLSAWMKGEAQPTFRQLEDFAKRTRTSVGALLLPSPPEEPLPVTDFRRVSGADARRPSADLLDTLYLCQQRQDWYRDYARLQRLKEVTVVGSSSLAEKPETVAGRWRKDLGSEPDERASIATWTDAQRQLNRRLDEAGVLVMVSGVVGSNTQRKLDPEEFRGFALSDPLAPVIFVNGADTKAAQIFTLAHELGHLCLGTSGVSDVTARRVADGDVESWCNRFAAEFLVPAEEFKTCVEDDLPTLARRFKVSTLVILRRKHDLGYLEKGEFWARFDAELARLRNMGRSGSSGGDFYATTMVRAGRRLTRAMTSAALEGQGSFTEARRLLGFQKMETFHELARQSWGQG